MSDKPITLLAIETSCDETAAAVIAETGDPAKPWARAFSQAPATWASACLSDSEYGGRRMPSSVMIPAM